MNIISITKTFQKEIPNTYLQIAPSKRLWLLFGSPLITVESGGSDAKAIAAKVSINKFIHKS